MPRGKVFNQSLASNALGDEAADNEGSNKYSSAKFTLIMPDSEVNAENEENTQLSMEIGSQKADSHSMNFKFTVLLVTLFVAVNIGLVALLDNDKPAEPVTASPIARDENKVAKLPEENLPVVKDNNVQPQQADIAIGASAEKLDHDKKPLPENPVLENTVPENPVTEKVTPSTQVNAKHVPAKPTVVAPAVHEDLFSIINKE